MAGPEVENDDGILLSAVRSGSERAFNTLIDRHQQSVRTFLRGLLANDSDADDIAQETFLAAWTQAKSFRGQGTVRSWLFSIAWRKARAVSADGFELRGATRRIMSPFSELRHRNRPPKLGFWCARRSCPCRWPSVQRSCYAWETGIRTPRRLKCLAFRWERLNRMFCEAGKSCVKSWETSHE